MTRNRTRAEMVAHLEAFFTVVQWAVEAKSLGREAAMRLTQSCYRQHRKPN